MRYITLVVVALALTLPDTASAQRYYRGGWDRSYRPYFGSHYYGGVYPYYSLGWSSYGYPGYSSSYYYPQTYYTYPQAYYSYPQTYYNYPQTYYNSPRTSLYYDPATSSRSTIDANVMSVNRARVEVIVSDPNAELYIQGQRMPGIGTTRSFTSPDLEQGKAFHYTITVKNTSNRLMSEDTRTVMVRAGAQVEVDFTKPDTQRLPLPNAVDPLLEKPK